MGGRFLVDWRAAAVLVEPIAASSGNLLTRAEVGRRVRVMDCYTSSIVVTVLVMAGALWASRDKSDAERLTIGGIALFLVIGSVLFRTGC